MSKHTPGPWDVATAGNGLPYQIVAPNGRNDLPGVVGKNVTRWAAISLPSSDEGKANARLMAAAPEMLEALKALADMAQQNVTDLGAIIQEGGEWTAEDRADLKRWGRVLEAIAKAEGAK